jgi:hypothetical protein
LLFAIALLVLPCAHVAASPQVSVGVGPAPNWVTATAILESAKDDAERLLLFDQQVRCGRGGSERYLRIARHLINASDLENASRIKVTYDPTFQTARFHEVTLLRGNQRVNVLAASGIRTAQRESDLDRQIYDGRKSAILFVPGVRVGDTLEYAFSIAGNDPTQPDRCVE